MVYLLYLSNFLVNGNNPSIICGWRQGKQCIWDDYKLDRISNYINDKLYGKQCVWYKNGKIYSISNYINDKLYGKRYVWYESGKLEGVSDYAKKCKHYTWYMTGTFMGFF